MLDPHTLGIRLALSSALALSACAGPTPADPASAPAVIRAALGQGCDCADGTWDLVDHGSGSTINVQGRSLCIDDGTFSGLLQMDAATRVCVDDDAAFISAQSLNLGGTFVNWGVAGTPETPFSFSAIAGTVIDNHGAMAIATANFNGHADITNHVDATIDFTTSFSLRNGSSMINQGIFRAVSNFDTSADSRFENEGYGYITGQLSFEGASENHGLLEITAKVNVNSAAHFDNTCTIVSHGTYNVNGAYTNDGLVYLHGDAEDLIFNVTGGGSMTQGPAGSVFVTSFDGLSGVRAADLRVDGAITGQGLVYVEDTTVVQGSGHMTGTPDAPLQLFDATPTGLLDGRLADVQTGTLTDVVRGAAPLVPSLLEAQLGLIGSDCRTLGAVHCFDDHPPSEIDTGCDETRPWCDTSGAVRRCVSCFTADDCSPGSLCVDGLCQSPDPIAAPDHLAAAEGSSAFVTFAELVANDTFADVTTVTLPAGQSTTTASGGTLVVAADGFSYTPPEHAPAQDVFRYQVCGVGNAHASCVTALVTIDINHRPTPGAPEVWVAVGTASVDVDVVPHFADPDGDGPADDVGVEHVVITTPATPGRRTVAYTACDDGLPPACGAGEIVVHVNDPPTLGAPEVVAGGGVTVVVPRGEVILGTGVVRGDDPTDGDTDGIGSVALEGPCALDAAGNLSISVPMTPGSYACHVTVCEELPPGSPAVCATTTVPVLSADPPDAKDDLYWGAKGSPVSGLVEGNDLIDPHGDATITLLGPTPSASTQGVVTVAPSGLVTFTPVASFAGTIALVYRLDDGLGRSDTATVTFIVNDPPVLTAPELEQPPGGHTTIPLGQIISGTGVVHGDDPTDGDTDALAEITVETGTNVCALSGASLAISAPVAAGRYTCRLRVCEELPATGPRACSTTTVTVIVPGTDPVDAKDDAFYGAQGSPVGGDVLPNDFVDTAHGGVAHVTVLGPLPSATTVGAISSVGGVVTLTPVASFAGVVTVLYQLDDGRGQSDVATITFTVNDPPTLAEPELTVYPGDAPKVPIDDLVVGTGVVHGDDPTDGDSDGIGTVTVDGDGCALSGDAVALTVPAEPGATTCEVTICEERPAGAAGVCATTTITIVRPEPPVARDDEATTPEDHAVTIDVTVNDDDDLAVTAISDPPAHGQAVVSEGGEVIYDPEDDFAGTDTFEYRTCDSHGQCDTATVSVTVTPAPDAPIANDDDTFTRPNTPVTIDLLANDRDPDGDALTVTNVTNPGHGTVTTAGVYTPAAGFEGEDAFDYTVCDPGGLCDSAHVTVLVTENRGPVGGDDEVTIDEDGTAEIPVLDNDRDPDGDGIEVTEVGEPGHGTATVDEDGTITYEPDPDFAGEDTFTYVVCDANGACATVTVTVTVSAVNDAPVALDDDESTWRGAAITFDARDNDRDPDGDPLTIADFGQPARGVVVKNADGTFTYTPPDDFVGTTTFEYSVSDPGGLGDGATVTLEVTAEPPVNHDPDAQDDAFAVPLDGTLTAVVLANDEDGDGDPLTIIAVVEPEHGTVVIGADGTLTYTPDPGFIGTDTFTYTVSDGRGGTDSAVVTVVVGDESMTGLIATGGGGCAGGTVPSAALIGLALAALVALARRRRQV